MNSAPSKPKGWLNLYLILLFIGGLPFIGISFIYVAVSVDNAAAAFGCLCGGSMISLCALKARTAFKKGKDNAVSFAKSGDIIFALTTIFYFVSLFFFELTPKVTALLAGVLIWCACWWVYLDKSNQVRKLAGQSRGLAKSGFALVCGAITLFVVLLAIIYAQMMSRHAEIRVHQEQERIRIEKAIAEWEATHGQEDAEDDIEDDTLEETAAPTPQTKPAPATPAKKVIDTGILTFSIPSSWRYEDDEFEFYVFDKDIPKFLLEPRFPAENASNVAESQLSRDMNDMLKYMPSVESYHVLPASTIKRNGLTIVYLKYDIKIAKDPKSYVMEGYWIYSTSNDVCMIISDLLHKGDNSIREVAESVRFED